MNITPFRPILAASKASDMTTEQFYAELRFPVIATPKYDGIRCVTMDLPAPPGHQSLAFTRSLKQIPNHHVSNILGRDCVPGLDGEIMTYEGGLFDSGKMRNFNNIQSDIMTMRGTPNWKYLVFDCRIFENLVYAKRLNALEKMSLPACCEKVPTTHIANLNALLEYEADAVARGFEGICFRDPNSPYKHGRSTLRQGYLIKMKRFVTEEAVVIGMEEEMANNNPQVLGTTGYAERSSHSAQMVGKGRMGALICRNKLGEFKVGTGFTHTQRQNIWDTQVTVIGRTITFKHQPHGSKDLPRIPVFVGFRSLLDL